MSLHVEQPLVINQDTILEYCRTKDPKADIYFIQCLLGLYDIDDKMNGIAPYTLRKIEPLAASINITLPSIYMMEKCWSDMQSYLFLSSLNDIKNRSRNRTSDLIIGSLLV